MKPEVWERVVSEYRAGKTVVTIVRENPELFTGDRIARKAGNLRKALKRRGVQRHSPSEVSRLGWQTRRVSR